MKQTKFLTIILLSTFFINFIIFSKNVDINYKKSSEFIKNSSLIPKESYKTTEDIDIKDDFATTKDEFLPFTGLFVEFNKDNNIKTAKNYIDGKLNGKSYSFYNNGALLKVTNYLNNELDGEEIEFYSNGISKIIKLYNKNKLDGTSYEYDLTGVLTSITNYKNNMKNGKSYIVSNDVITLENNYINDILNGNSTSYYLDGSFRSSGQYISNLREGEWIWKYPDGTIKLIENYNKGKIQGDIIGYFPNGIKEREFHNINGKGNFIQYYDNGNVKVIGSYENYLAIGDWKFYDKNGKLIYPIPETTEENKKENEATLTTNTTNEIHSDNHIH